MTTSNQIELRKLEQTKVRDKEYARSNRAKERNDRNRTAIEGLSNIAKIGTGVIGAINDPSWYNLDPQLVKDTANISYNTPLGVEVPNGFKPVVQPGIMRLNYQHTLATNSDLGNNIADTAAKNIYAYVRYANSGSRNYEASDLLMYLLAMDEAYSFHAFMCRLYSLCLTAKGENRYYLDAMITAAKGSASDLRQHLPELRAYINSFAVRLNSFYVPKTMPLYDRHYWMNSNIFKDSPVKKSQLYMFVPDKFGVYNDVAGKIQFSDPSAATVGKVYGYDTLRQMGESILNGLINSEDIGIMSGDILKAYGESELYFISNIQEDFHIESIYSEEVLSQINNATMVGTILSSVDIVQDGNSVVYQGQSLANVAGDPAILGRGTANGMLVTFGRSILPSATMPAMYVDIQLDEYIINMYKDNVTPDENMVATRLTCLGDCKNGFWRVNSGGAATTNTAWGYRLNCCGSEVIINATIYTLSSDVSLAIV